MVKKRQVNWWRTDLGKEAISSVQDSIRSKRVTQGPLTEELETKIAKLLEVPYAVLTTSGSTALLMSLLAHGIGRGDEVIIPALTFVATAQAPLFLGAKVKLADVENSRPVIDVAQIEKAITKRTKAIIPVHLNGRAADMTAILRLSKKYGIRVIEDAAQAMYSRGSSGYLGAQADLGIFSLAITKLITTVQGGVVVTKSKDIYHRLLKIRSYGLLSRTDSAYPNLAGFNFRFNDFLASMGLSQIKKIKKQAKSVKEVYAFYKRSLEKLKSVEMIDVDVSGGGIPLWTEILCRNRKKVIETLRKNHIEAKAYDRTIADLLGLSRKKFKNAEFYAKHGLILPSGPDQLRDDLKRVADVLKSMDAEQ